jgi:hypothetical protein
LITHQLEIIEVGSRDRNFNLGLVFNIYSKILFYDEKRNVDFTQSMRKRKTDEKTGKSTINLT